MSQVSRPMQIALVATLLFAAVWMVALRPKSQGGEEAAAPAPAPAQTAPAPSSGAAPGTDGLTGAIDKAEDAVARANGEADAPARAGASPSAGGSPVRSPGGRPAAGARSTGRPPRSGPARVVEAALRQRKAVAIAFVDTRTADARAVAREVGLVSKFGGRALALSVPLTQLSDFDFITNRVEVTVSPTVVIVDSRRRASTIVGFADRGEIEQRLADAVASKRGR